MLLSWIGRNNRGIRESCKLPKKRTAAAGNTVEAQEIKSPLETRGLYEEPKGLAGFGAGVHSLLQLSAAQACGANAHSLARAVHDRADRPQVHIPTPLRHVVSVADVISKLRSLAAHIAYACHETLQAVDSIAASEGDFRKARL